MFKFIEQDFTSNIKPYDMIDAVRDAEEKEVKDIIVVENDSDAEKVKAVNVNAFEEVEGKTGFFVIFED